MRLTLDSKRNDGFRHLFIAPEASETLGCIQVGKEGLLSGDSRFIGSGIWSNLIQCLTPKMLTAGSRSGHTCQLKRHDNPPVRFND
jgi:hypothetical protein